jgi:hypothetical protein
MNIELRDSKISQELQADDPQYLKGKENWAMRMYYYLRQGLGVLNDFHNIFLALITFALVFKVTSIPILVSITVVTTVLMVFIGYYAVHHYNKFSEWLNMRFGTHFGIKQFNYTQGTYELLAEIRDLLKKNEVQPDK